MCKKLFVGVVLAIVLLFNITLSHVGTANADYLGVVGETVVVSGSGGLEGPVDLVIGADGDLYVTGYGGRILRFDLKKTPANFLEIVHSFFDPNHPNEVFLHLVRKDQTLPLPPRSSLYVANANKNEIYRFTGLLNILFNYDFKGIFSSSPNLKSPLGMAFGPDGNLYVANFETSSILRFDGSTGEFMGTFASGGGMDGTVDLAFGPDGHLYVVCLNNDRIFQFEGQKGSGSFMGTFASGHGLNHPTALTFGPDGNLYVAEYGNNKILRFNGSTGAFMGTFVEGSLEPGYGGLMRPTSLIFGPDGKLYVTSFLNNKVLRYEEKWLQGCPEGVLDEDKDGVCDNIDNCPGTPNADQSDSDQDGLGDACDRCPNVPSPNNLDSDNDGYGDVCDNCPTIPNRNQDPNACKDNDNDGFVGYYDCDDNNPTVYPGAPEICSDGIGQDCNVRPRRDISCLEMYAPVLYISERYYTTPGSGADFKPKHIDSMLKESKLLGPAYWVCTEEACICTDGYIKWDGLDSRWVCTEHKCTCVWGYFEHTYAKKPVDISSLYANNDNSFYLDMTGADPGLTAATSTIPNPDRFNGYDNTVYGREEVFGYGSLDYGFYWGAYRVLQYWFFYPYNDFAGDRHEGDWEMIQIILDESTRQPLPSPKYSITYSQHGGGKTRTWDDPAVEKVKDTHPIVYVAEGSHASYFKQGEPSINCFTEWMDPVLALTPYSLYWEIEGLSKERYELIPISNATPWVNWNGRWGEIDGGTWVIDPATVITHTSGPTGPGRKDKWNKPINFANDPGSPGYSGCAFSPVEIHVYDSAGNHVGPTATGEIEINIPGVYLYDPENNRFIINTTDELTFKIAATESGKFDFTFTRYQTDISEHTAATYKDIQITGNTIATVSANVDNPNYTMEVDQDGDGGVDLTKTPDDITVTQIPIGNLDETAVPVSFSAAEDGDADGILDSIDNCPGIFNPDQIDSDKDGLGDECDNDIDNDNIPNAVDNCPNIYNPDQADKNNNGIGDACEPDTTPPTIVIGGCPERVNLLATASITVAVSDNESGVEDQSVPNGTCVLDTSRVGMNTFIVTARDNSGNEDSNTCTYQVIYDFKGSGGFQPPVEDPPVTNTAKAGSTVPVKWQLPNGSGGFISDLGAVLSIELQEVSCANVSETVTDGVKAAGAGKTGVRYDFAANQYVYNWKTSRIQAGKCYALCLKLNDGTRYYANFSLK